MKKIIIITRAFPPSNKTAAYRAFSFAKYFSKYGYYPIIITRSWSSFLINENDANLPSGSNVVHEKKEGYEVYYIPFKGTLTKRFTFKNKLINKLLFLIEIYFGKLAFLNPYYNIYKFASTYLKNNEVDILIVTAPPFDLLQYGYKLAEKHKVKWIADYRDEWTSEGSILNDANPTNFFSKIVYNTFLSKQQQQQQEIHYTKNCSAFTTVSNQAIENIEKIIHKKGTLIVNGFDVENHNLKQILPLFNTFTISYAGWLYPSQQIEILCNAIKQLANTIPSLNLKLLFIGGKSFDGMEKRLLNLMQGYERYIELTNRVSKKESIEMQQQSHLLLLSAHKGKNGIPSSKLYEYIGSQKTILLCPSDKGVIESTLSETNQAIICNTVNETVECIQNLYYQFINNNTPLYKKVNHVAIQKYSREKQVEKFALLLNQLQCTT